MGLVAVALPWGWLIDSSREPPPVVVVSLAQSGVAPIACGGIVATALQDALEFGSGMMVDTGTPHLYHCGLMGNVQDPVTRSKRI